MAEVGEDSTVNQGSDVLFVAVFKFFTLFQREAMVDVDASGNASFVFIHLIRRLTPSAVHLASRREKLVERLIAATLGCPRRLSLESFILHDKHKDKRTEAHIQDMPKKLYLLIFLTVVFIEFSIF